MPQKIAILTDSSSSIYKIDHSFQNVFMIDIPCFLGDTIFTNFAVNKDTAFHKALETTTLVPKTSQPSAGETLEKYEEIKALGYTDIIFLPISRELSGTYQSATLAKEMIDGINIHIVDTLTTVSILSSLTLLAAKLAKEGKSVTDILAQINESKTKWGYYLTVNDLTALIKNGRLSNAKGFIANVLKLKPVIKFSLDGKLTAIGKVRTYKKAILEVVEKVIPEVDPKTGVFHVSVTNNTADADYAIQLIRERVPNAKIERHFLPATVVAHVGLAAVGVGFINQ